LGIKCSGVNLAGILGDADADREGLMGRGGERWVWGEVTFFTRGRVWEGTRSPPQKKKDFSLEMACFGAFFAVFFVLVFARKMLNFRPKW